MARMRSAKLKLKHMLHSPHWREHLDDIAQGGLENVGPLFSFLLLGPLTMHRAAALWAGPRHCWPPGSPRRPAISSAV